MNPYLIADNRTFKIGDIEVRQILVKELDIIECFASEIKNTLRNKIDDESIKQILRANLNDCIKLCSYLTNIELPKLIHLSLNDDQKDLFELMKVVIKLNEAYFIDEKKRKNKEEAAEKSDIFNAFQMLVSAGHSHESVMNMSYSAFVRYLKAVQFVENGKTAQIASAVRMAQYAKDNKFRDYIKTLIEV